MEKTQYLGALEIEADAFIAAVGRDMELQVSHCGEWAIRDLAVHLGSVWQFATANTLAGGEKDGPANPWANDETSPDSELVNWLNDSKDRMLEVLHDADPEATAWTFASNNQTAGFWQRRMVAETIVHRWDAEHCIYQGAAKPIDRELAAEGIDEYTEVGLRFSSSRPDRTYPASSLHLHCTDTDGEWLIVGDGGTRYSVTREHAKGDAAVKGTASALLLWIWGRDGGPVEIFGDEAVATTWRELAP